MPMPRRAEAPKPPTKPASRQAAKGKTPPPVTDAANELLLVEVELEEGGTVFVRPDQLDAWRNSSAAMTRKNVQIALATLEQVHGPTWLKLGNLPGKDKAEPSRYVSAILELLKAAVHGEESEGVRSARFEARLSESQRSLFKLAAELEGRSVSDFVVNAAQDAAMSAIERAALIHISVADQRKFATTLATPPAPSPALKRAFRKRSQLTSAK